MATWAEAVKDIPINPIFQKASGTETPAGSATAESGTTDSKAAPNSGSEPPDSGAKLAESGTKPQEGEAKPDENGADGSDAGAEGENGQEAAEPAKEQTPEERHRNAEARKARERESFKQELKADMDRQFAVMQDQFICGLGLLDPYHGDKPVTTKAEYDAYLAARNSETVNAELEEAGLQRGVIDKLIEQHPDVVAARQAAAETAAEKTRVLDGAAEKRLDDEIKAISAYDDSVKTADDLLAAENYDAVRRLVQAGASISEAWKAVNLDKVLAHEREAAAQAVRNGVTGKDHMKGTVQGRGEGALEMPAAVKKQFQMTYPGLSDEEIGEKYKRIVEMQKK